MKTGKRFQFTHPCGCDRSFPESASLFISFNSRTRVGATFGGFPIRRNPGRFNSRTRVGATRFRFRKQFLIIVSIHAPVWVRPMTLFCPGATVTVSIHAPVWVRLLASPPLARKNLFQFTHPCGCDTLPWLFPFRGRVSIHAPVWVRPRGRSKYLYAPKFQFTHPCGCDIIRDVWESGRAKFQFTHPCGCDQEKVQSII